MTAGPISDLHTVTSRNIR